MDKATRVYNLAKKLSEKDIARIDIMGKTIPFDWISARLQQKYLDLATEQLHQQEAKEEAERDEYNKGLKIQIVEGALAKLPANAIAGRSEVSYMTDVMLKCGDIPLSVLKNIFTADVLIAFYYGELTVDASSEIIHKAFLNFKDKTAMIAALAKKTKGDSK